MAGEVARIAKPQLRGLLTSQIKKNLIVTFALVFSVATAFKFTIMDSRKRRYAEYYKNLDTEDMFQKMKAAGLFNSVPK